MRRPRLTSAIITLKALESVMPIPLRGGVNGKTIQLVRMTKAIRVGARADLIPGIGMNAKIPPTRKSTSRKCRTSVCETIRLFAPKWIPQLKSLPGILVEMA
jgi:hypothetical protein